MIDCTTPACHGNVNKIEGWRLTPHVEVAAAVCKDCNGAYWMVKRGTQVAVKNRSPIDFDQRVSDRN